MLSAKFYYIAIKLYCITAEPYKLYCITTKALSLIGQWGVIGLVPIYSASKTLKKRLFPIKLYISKALN